MSPRIVDLLQAVNVNQQQSQRRPIPPDGTAPLTRKTSSSARPLHTPSNASVDEGRRSRSVCRASTSPSPRNVAATAANRCMKTYRFERKSAVSDSQTERRPQEQQAHHARRCRDQGIAEAALPSHVVMAAMAIPTPSGGRSPSERERRGASR
jgi:hypothetical protein